MARRCGPEGQDENTEVSNEQEDGQATEEDHRPDRRRNRRLNPEGVQPVGLHDPRHSAAGLAFESLALNEVSRLLRHANPRVTTTVYGGISDNAATAIGNKPSNAGFGT